MPLKIPLNKLKTTKIKEEDTQLYRSGTASLYTRLNCVVNCHVFMVHLKIAWKNVLRHVKNGLNGRKKYRGPESQAKYWGPTHTQHASAGICCFGSFLAVSKQDLVEILSRCLRQLVAL